MGLRRSFACWWSVVRVVACLAVPTAVHARTFVLRADGSGDVPTFQAGLDSLTATDVSPYRDTLVVESGFYDEDAVLTSNQFGHTLRYVIHCPGGPERTGLRSLTARGGSLTGIKIEGLSVTGPTATGNLTTLLVDCRFDGPLSVTSYYSFDFYDSRRCVGCVFRGRSILTVSGSLDTCRFEGTAYLQPNDDPMFLRSCEFVGQDTAAVTQAGPYHLEFDGCRFSQANWGIFDRSFGQLGVAGCTFRDIREAAIGREEPLNPFDTVRPVVTDSRFERCGSAVRVRFPGTEPDVRPFWLRMSADTVVDSRGTAISVSTPSTPTSLCDLNGLHLMQTGGTGIDLEGALAIEVANSLVTGCRDDAIRVKLSESAGNGTQAVGPDEPPTASFFNNTLALNGAAGLSVGPQLDGQGSGPPVAINGNIFAANDGGGMISTLPYPVTLHRNDTWMNGGEALVGVADADSNLTLDPQFCDPLAGDFHVATSSPCAPSGPYGLIGALGVGCDVMTVPVDVQSQPINLRSNAPVQAAILGTRLFDARRVDPSTVRLAGAAPSPRGSGRTAPQLADANHDGFVDLLLFFDSRDLHIERSTATLEGRTSDGASFGGADVVEVARVSPPTSLDGLTGVPARLALAAPAIHGVLTLLVDLPGRESAAVEVFDVGGRRILSKDLSALGPGRYRLQLGEALTTGLYLARLTQGRDAVTARAVVIR